MLKLFVDGSAAPNPGLGGAGFVLYDDDEMIMKGYVYLGEKVTNNQAEFLAVLHSSFHVINKLRPKEVSIHTDSELVYSAFLGIKHVRNPILSTYLKAGLQALACIETVNWVKISRLTNGYADNLARRAVDRKNSEVYMIADRIPVHKEET